MYDILIAGGGPVGIGLAIELGRRGVRVGVVERHMEPQRIPKGQNLTQRTLDLFHSWGIADALRSRRLIRPGYPGKSIVAYGDLMSEHWYCGVYRTAVDKYYFQRSERLPIRSGAIPICWAINALSVPPWLTITTVPPGCARATASTMLAATCASTMAPMAARNTAASTPLAR